MPLNDDDRLIIVHADINLPWFVGETVHSGSTDLTLTGADGRDAKGIIVESTV